jgi:Tautomerase enzyme
MPLITFTLLKGKSATYKQGLGNAVMDSLISIGVPDEDRFQRFIELEEENFIYSTTYPDLTTPRSKDFVLIEILFSVGRSVKIKKKLLATLLEKLKPLELAPKDVFVVFKETAWENWAFANGEILHA